MSTLTSINIFGGPGTGKSTTAAAVFAALKQQGKNVELSVEYAKSRVYEEHWSMFPDQVYIFAQMLRQYHRVEGKVDYMVSDSPLLLSVVYGRWHGMPYKSLEPLIVEAVNSYHNINIMLERTVDYQSTGRNQDIEQAEQLDILTSLVLSEYDQPIITLPVDDSTVGRILNLIP
jgi:Cdc6-like AAA superfamily ATPase